MEKKDYREQAIAESPEDELYLRAYFALSDMSEDYKKNEDSRQYAVNRLLNQLESIKLGAITK